MFANVEQANAENFDAGFVMNKMTSDQQVSYIAGVIEGLAYSRWLRDRPNTDGMNCIYNWYSRTDKWGQIESFFGLHPDKSVGPLLYILTKKDCGA